MSVSEVPRKQFDELDVYWTFFDPPEREKPASRSLANDIAEIYLDLKDTLNWQWKFDFREHRSRHAAEALKVLLLQLECA
jgi:hypothetical protein